MTTLKLVKQYRLPIKLDWVTLFNRDYQKGIHLSFVEDDTIVGFLSYEMQYGSILNLLGKEDKLMVEIRDEFIHNSLYEVENSPWENIYLTYNNKAINLLDKRLETWEDGTYRGLFEKPEKLNHFFITFENSMYLHILSSKIIESKTRQTIDIETYYLKKLNQYLK